MDPRLRRSDTAGRPRFPLAVLALALLALAACGDLEESESHYPVKLEPVAGTDLSRVTFEPEGAERVGIQTTPVRREGGRKIIPYSAVIYDAEGKAYAYTSPKPLTYVREAIEIEDVEGDRALLSDGPPLGTEVVTVGAAEVYGSEFEVDH